MKLHRNGVVRQRTILCPSASFIISILLFLPSCSTISPFDQYAYVQGINLKIESLNLMDKAVDSVGQFEDQIGRLEMNLQKAYEYENGRPNNEISSQMWSILISPEKKLLGGFLHRWKEQKIVGKVYLSEKKKVISDAFDLIVQLESHKIKDNEAQGSFLKSFSE